MPLATSRSDGPNVSTADGATAMMAARSLPPHLIGATMTSRGSPRQCSGGSIATRSLGSTNGSREESLSGAEVSGGSSTPSSQPPNRTPKPRWRMTRSAPRSSSTSIATSELGRIRGIAASASSMTESVPTVVARARDSESSSRARSAARRSASSSRAFSNATPTVEAMAWRSRRSSSSNWSIPSLDNTMVPTTRRP